MSSPDDILIGVDISEDDEPSPLLIVDPKTLQVHADFSGASRKGKSRLATSLLLQKLSRGEQIIVLDPPGTMYNLLRDYMIAMDDPDIRERVWFVNLPKATEQLDVYPSLDFLGLGLPAHTVAEMLLDVFHRIWTELDAAPSFDANVLMAASVLSTYDLPLTELDKVLTNKIYRDHLLTGMPNSQAYSYFKDYFDKHERASATNLTGSTLRRTHRLNFSPELHYSLASRTEYNLAAWAKILESKTSAIINLNFRSKLSSQLWGTLLLVAIEQAALSRTELSEDEQHPITVFVDEAPRFISKDTDTVNTFLQQTAKSGLSLWLCYQDLGSIKDVQEALGNCQLRVAFQCSPENAEYFAPIFFEVDPLRVKDSVPGPGMGSRVTFFSASEQWEVFRGVLSRLPKREAFVRLPDDDSCKIYTPDIPDLKIDQRRRDEFESHYFAKLFRPRHVIEHELEQRRAWALGLVRLDEMATDNTILQEPAKEKPTKKDIAPQQETPKKEPPAQNVDATINHAPPAPDNPAPPPDKDDDDEENLIGKRGKL